MLTHDEPVNPDFMREALMLASLRRGFCAPNPSVGAVVVRNGNIIARGVHWAFGCAHAEVDALSKVTPAELCDATLYVSLEPCCHFGKTPPCTNRIIQAGVRRVAYGLRDPNPRVAGKGEQALLAAGIACQHFELPELTDYYRSYCYWQQTQRPWVTAKLALSLDGKIAARGGEPVAITGPELLRYTHECRKRSDAILTTAKTICQDNPQLTARLGDELVAKPVYILDRLLTTPRNARLFKTAMRLTFFHQLGLDASEYLALGARCVGLELEPGSSRLCLQLVLDYIGAEGVHDLWVEAGGQCLQAFCEQHLLNHALLYIGAKRLGREAQAAFAPDFDVFVQAPTLRWQVLGGDVVCHLIYSG